MKNNNTHTQSRNSLEAKHPQALTVLEAEKLLDVLLSDTGTLKQKHKGIRNYTIGLFMLDAGLRVGEVTQLLITDCMFNSEPVTSIIIRPEIAKNDKERQIPLSGRLRNALKMMGRHFWSLHAEYGTAYAFYETQKRAPLSTRQVERIIHEAGLVAFGKPVHPHMLRHTFATKLMRVTDIRTIQTLLGHDQVSSTQIYTHPDDRDLKNAIDRLDNGEIR